MNYFLRFTRSYSTQIIPKGWVKFNGTSAIRVPTKECDYVIDFIKNVKKEFAPQFNNIPIDEITLHSPESSKALYPGLSIADALNNNSVETPLYVKLLYSSSPLSKTISIQDIDEDCRPIDSFNKIVVENDADLNRIFKGNISALYLLSNPKELVTKFKQLIDGEKYNVHSRNEISKTISIQDIDEDCRPIDSFNKIVVENDADLNRIFKGNISALYLLSNPKELITKFKQLVDGEKYNVHSRNEISKTISIQKIDEDCRPIDSFNKIVVENDADLNRIYERRGSALYLLSNPKELVTKFKQLIDGEKYRVFSHYESSYAKEERWQQVEDKAMEEETLLAMNSFLINHLGPRVVKMPTNIMGSDGNTIVQEWDAVFKVDNVLYLCEAKHNMTLQQMKKVVERLKQFKNFKINAQEEFRHVEKIVGVLCGIFFPEDVRTIAHELEFICIYPSGNRYGVETPPTEFTLN